MKKLSFIFIFIACLLITACSKDNEPNLELSAEYLEATTWDAELSIIAYPDPTANSAHFVIQFLTKGSGKCIPTYGDTAYEGGFTYNIVKDMITFNGSLVGNWTVIEHTKTRIVLQAFLPNEYNLVLTKM